MRVGSDLIPLVHCGALRASRMSVTAFTVVAYAPLTRHLRAVCLLFPILRQLDRHRGKWHGQQISNGLASAGLPGRHRWVPWH